MREYKVRLVKYYLLFSLGLAVGFLLVHWLSTSRNDGPPVTAGSYWKYFLVAGVGVYFVYYRRYVGSIRLINYTGFMMVGLFLMGSFIACHAVVNIFNDFHQKIVTVETADQIAAVNSNYFQIQKLSPDLEVFPDKLNTRLESSSRMLDLEYTALVPLVLDSPARNHEVWIELSHDEKYPRGSDAEVEQLKDEGLPRGRAWAKQYPFDSITWFERSQEKVYTILKEHHYPVNSETVILKPSTGVFKFFHIGALLMYLGMYIFPSLLFAGLVWTIDRKPGSSQSDKA